MPLRRLFAALGLLMRPGLALVVALALSAPALAVPALWQVGRGSRSVTIYGTIHALPPGQNWFTPAAARAFAAADDLVVEVVFPEDPQQMALAMAGKARLAQPVPILERVPPALRGRLSELLAASGLPMAGFDHYKSWYVALLLVQIDMMRAGLDPASGVDVALVAKARAAGRRLVGLESVEGQLNLFDSLPEADQRLLLASAVEDGKDAVGQMKALVAAWSAGNVARILSDFDDSSLSPAIRQNLFVRRNAAWANWVAAALKRPGRHFMAVGAAHMAGPDSLIAMLRARGLQVRRVE